MHDRFYVCAMEIEAKFAAVVASARGRTRLADAEGTEQRVTEVLIIALCDLWDEGTAAGFSPIPNRDGFSISLRPPSAARPD